MLFVVFTFNYLRFHISITTMKPIYFVFSINNYISIANLSNLNSSLLIYKNKNILLLILLNKLIEQCVLYCNFIILPLNELVAIIYLISVSQSSWLNFLVL